MQKNYYVEYIGKRYVPVFFYTFDCFWLFVTVYDDLLVHCW